MADLNGFIGELGDIPFDTDAGTVRRKSRDMTLMFSPTMKREFSERTADVFVQPRVKADIIRIAAAAARHRVPLIARGGGTCNFGQGIPLYGGAIVDTTALDKIVKIDGARVRAETGARLIDIDAATRPTGWELRMHSSTKRAATIGGFVGGGHAGVGSCAYGILRDSGNILGLEVVSVEETPRVVELRGPDVNLVHHAYGSNGLITEVEMPLAPAWPWVELLVTFPEFMDAVRFAHAAAISDGLVKKLLSVSGWPIPAMIEPLAPFVPAGHSMVLCMVAGIAIEGFEALAKEFRGSIATRAPEGKGPYGFPIYEFAWGHTRLHVNKVERSINGAVGLFPPDDLVASIERAYNRFRDVGPLHLEAKRFDGALSFQGSPFFKHRDDSDLAAVIAGLEAAGARVANSHTFLVKEGGMKSVADADIAFKRSMDPYDLLNPGKMDFGARELKVASAAAAIQTSGWKYRDAS
jgi:FAD/FMN-containing dehydrogenase